MSTNRPPLPSGNRCGHDPRRLWLDDAFLRATPIGPLSPAIIKIQRWLKACFISPPVCPLFHHQAGLRQIRSERREACLLVLPTLFRHLEPESLLIGTQQPDGRFVSLSMRDIALETGLGLRRCERVISDLKQAGALERVNSATGQSQALALFRDFIDWLICEASIWEMERNRENQSDLFAVGGQL